MDMLALIEDHTAPCRHENDRLKARIAELEAAGLEAIAGLKVVSEQLAELEARTDPSVPAANLLDAIKAARSRLFDVKHEVGEDILYYLDEVIADAAIAAPPAIDPDMPRRFRWRDQDGVIKLCVYFPGCGAWCGEATASGMGVLGLPDMPDIEWIDAAPAEKGAADDT